MTATVHLYVFDGYADWEPAFAMAGIADPRFQREPGAWQVKTVASRADRPIRSMGGVTVLPDLALDELLPSASALLIVPGVPAENSQPARLPTTNLTAPASPSRRLAQAGGDEPGSSV